MNEDSFNLIFKSVSGTCIVVETSSLTFVYGIRHVKGSAEKDPGSLTM